MSNMRHVEEYGCDDCHEVRGVGRLPGVEPGRHRLTCMSCGEPMIYVGSTWRYPDARPERTRELDVGPDGALRET